MTKTLIVGPAWVGDMIMAQSLFQLLKQRNPTQLIDVLAPESTYSLLSRMPEINKGILLPLKHGIFNVKERYKIGSALRHESYDQTILLTNSWKSALIPFFAKIPQRIGWLGEMRWGLVNDIRYLEQSQFPLMIERFMVLGLDKEEKLPPHYPWPALQVSSVQVQDIIQMFSLKPYEKPILALCPGAEYGSAKRWLIEHFATVAKTKLAQGWQVWLLGGNKDQSITAEIQAITNNQCCDLAGKTTLLEAIDLLSLSSIVVSNDSGLMHIAAALKKLLIVIYGSTDPRFTPPLTEKVKILTLNLPCSPCFKRECPLGHTQCLRDLTPHSVLMAIEELMHESLNY